jgi:hypothetical protein
MKMYYCWRCKIDMPMLDEDEWTQIAPLLVNQSKLIKSYRAQHLCDIKTAVTGIAKPATVKYQEMTGFVETNHYAIYHHRLQDYGSECQRCGHLFRTPRANFSQRKQ